MKDRGLPEALIGSLLVDEDPQQRHAEKYAERHQRQLRQHERLPEDERINQQRRIADEQEQRKPFVEEKQRVARRFVLIEIGNAGFKNFSVHIL